MGYQTRGKVWEFPTTGTTGNGHYQTPALTALTTTGTLLAVPTGESGVITKISLIDSVGTQFFLDGTLNLYYGGEATPTTSIPWGALWALDSPREITGSTVYDTPFFAVDTPPKSVAGDASTAVAAGYFAYPIPFPNGVMVTLTAAVGTHSIWASCDYASGLGACWNRNYRWTPVRAIGSTGGLVSQGTRRVKIVANVGTVSVGLADAAQAYPGKSIYDNNQGKIAQDLYVSAQTGSTFLTFPAREYFAIASGASTQFSYSLANHAQFVNRAAGKDGYVVALYASLRPDDLDTSAILEGNPRFFVNRSTSPSHEWTGTEDFFDGFNYWVGGQFLQQRAGCMTNPGVGTSVTAYRIFDRDPIHYTDGCLASWPCLTASGGTTVSIFTTILYEQV